MTVDTSSPFLGLVSAYRRRLTMRTVLAAVLTASRRGAIALVAAACLGLVWPVIPAQIPIAAALLAFAWTLVASILDRSQRREITVAADNALDAGSLLVSAVEIEQHPGHHDPAAGLHTMQLARTALPSWETAIPDVVRLPAARAYLLPLAFIVAGSALLALHPGGAMSESENPPAAGLDSQVSEQVGALRESLRSPQPVTANPDTRAARSELEHRREPVGGGQHRNAAATGEQLAEIRRTGDRSDSRSTQTAAVSGNGSRAGFAAGADTGGAPLREDVKLDIIETEIERSGATVANTTGSDSTGFAVGSVLAPASAGGAMPAAALATGATDFELTPAERGYYERYRRYQEAKP